MWRFKRQPDSSQCSTTSSTPVPSNFILFPAISGFLDSTLSNFIPFPDTFGFLDSTFLFYLSKNFTVTMKATNIQCLALALTAASAHTIMQAVGVGSTVNKQGLGIYMPSDDGVSTCCHQENHVFRLLMLSLVHRRRYV